MTTVIRGRWFNLINCNLYDDDVLVFPTGSEAYTVSVDKVLTLKADDGFRFEESIGILIDDGLGQTEYEYIDIEDERFNDDKTEFNFKISQFQIGYTSFQGIKATAFEKPPADKDFTINSKFINLYIANDDVLDSISDNRMYQGFDYTDFILDLYVLPFNIDNIVDVERPILLGDLEIINASTLIKDVVHLEIANIDVPPKYDNVYDYKDVDVKLYLPYVEPIDIPVEYVIGYNIKVEYIIDLYTGETIINVTSSSIDKVIISRFSKIGRQIPYIRNENTTIDTTDRFIVNNVETPFIEIKRNIPYNENGFFDVSNGKFDLIGNYEGFVQVDEIKIDTLATYDEQIEINNILKQGIIIK